MKDHIRSEADSFGAFVKSYSVEVEELGRKILSPASHYGECVRRHSQVGLKENAASSESRRREREYQRAFDDWLASKPGTVEAVELLQKWLAMPSC